MEKNQFFEAPNVREYLAQYVNEIKVALKLIAHADAKSLELAFTRLMMCTQNGGTIYVAGNGGSAAISEHLTCDFTKGAGLKVHSLCDLALLTALANDIGFESVFSERLRMLKASQKDCLILISSSGNSPNIIRAAEYAKEIDMPTIGLTGFSGGKLKELCDVSLHIPVNNYGVVEDAHQAIMHCLAQWAVCQAEASRALPLKEPPADPLAK